LLTCQQEVFLSVVHFEQHLLQYSFVRIFFRIKPGCNAHSNSHQQITNLQVWGCKLQWVCNHE